MTFAVHGIFCRVKGVKSIYSPFVPRHKKCNHKIECFLDFQLKVACVGLVFVQLSSKTI